MLQSTRPKRIGIVCALIVFAVVLLILAAKPVGHKDPGLKLYNEGVAVAAQAEEKLARYTELTENEISAALADIASAILAYTDAARKSSNTQIRGYALNNAALLLVKYVDNPRTPGTALRLITEAVRVLPYDEDVLRNHELIYEAMSASQVTPTFTNVTGLPGITGLEAAEITDALDLIGQPGRSPPTVHDDGL